MIPGKRHDGRLGPRLLRAHIWATGNAAHLRRTRLRAVKNSRNWRELRAGIESVSSKGHRFEVGAAQVLRGGLQGIEDERGLLAVDAVVGDVVDGLHEQDLD